MEIGEIVLKMRKYPMYIGTGAGKLARKWNTTIEVVKEAKAIALGKKVSKVETVNTGPKILILDIETSPMRGYVWSRWNQNIHLDQTISEWFMLTWAAKWLYSAEILSDRLAPNEVLLEDDKRIVTSLRNLLEEADIVIAHNGDRFDIPKINSRLIVNDLLPVSSYIQIDTKKISARQFGFSSNKLDALAGYFGFEHKYDTDFELWSKCMMGDRESLVYMETYNKKDVELLEEIYIKLRPWIKPHPNISLYYTDVTVPQCSTCGSTQVEELDGKFYYTSVGVYPIYRCSCGAHSRGRKSVADKTKNKYTLTAVAK